MCLAGHAHMSVYVYGYAHLCQYMHVWVYTRGAMCILFLHVATIK